MEKQIISADISEIFQFNENLHKDMVKLETYQETIQSSVNDALTHLNTLRDRVQLRMDQFDDEMEEIEDKIYDYLCRNEDVDISNDSYLNSLYREKSQLQYQIDELSKYIDNVIKEVDIYLDPVSVNIRKNKISIEDMRNIICKSDDILVSYCELLLKSKKKLQDQACDMASNYGDKSTSHSFNENINHNSKEDSFQGSMTVLKETCGAGVDKKLMSELANCGVKYNANDVIMITKNSNGKLVWLEKGNSSAGYQHILDHAVDFETKGISSNQLSDFVSTALSKGEIVGMQGTRPIYEVMYNGSLQRVAITIGNNGFIVGANPVSLP